MGAALSLLKNPSELQAQREAICDEFGELKRREAEFSPTAARLKILRETIASWAPADLPADQGTSFSGKLYVVNIAPRQNERAPSDLAKLFKSLGSIKFFSICKIGVGALENLLGKVSAAAWLSEDRTGPRTVTAVAKARPEIAA